MIRNWLKSERTARGKKKLLIVALGCLFAISLGQANAQTTTLRNPLIPGYQHTPPFVPPHECAPPPIGDGSVPAGINPGMTGPPTLLPWVPLIPANQIDIENSRVNLGVDNSVETPPGVLGKSLTVPPPPSTPGPDPGMLPGHPGFQPPAAIVNIKPDGGMPGDLAPKKRWGGQTTGDFGLYRTHGSQLNDFGQKPKDKPDKAKDPVPSEDGPRKAEYPGERNRDPNKVQGKDGQPTQDLYGNRMSIPGKPRALMTIAPY